MMPRSLLPSPAQTSRRLILDENAPWPDRSKTVETPLSKEEEEALRALGYVE